MPNRSRTFLLAFASLFVPASLALAQAPSLTAVWPPGGMRGETLSLQIEGENLGSATAIHISGSGVTLERGAASPDGKSLPAKATIRADAMPGAREIRVVTPKGVTAPGYLWVGTLKHLPEAEPNNLPPQAMKLGSLPATIDGRINGATDVDWFEFEAQAGETFVFDIVANRLYSPLDGFLELQDAQGRLLAAVMEGYDRDPRIVYTFKKSGVFRLKAHDVQYRGGASYVYQLTLGKLPVITSLDPPGGKLGETFVAKVAGANLGGMTTLTVPMPETIDGAHWIVPETPGGPALPVRLVADRNPQFSAAGKSGPSPEKLPGLPVTVNGFLPGMRETRVFEFQAEAGKPIRIAVVSRSAGSRAHTLLRLLDTAGKELLNTEDQIGRDPQVTWTPPAAGIYRAEIAKIESATGEGYFFRLALTPDPPPGFRLTASPDIVSLGRGQTLVVTVNAMREGSFAGPIEVKSEGAPGEVQVSPLTIPPGAVSGIVTLTAPKEQDVAPFALRIAGMAEIPGKGSVTLAATPIGMLPRPGEGTLAPRAVTFQMAHVNDTLPLFTLSPEKTEVTLAPGETVSLKIVVSRKAGDNAANPAVNLEIRDLPPGVRAETPPIPEKQGEVTIRIIADGGAPAGQRASLLQGKIGDQNLQYAPAIKIVVKPKA